MIQFNEALPHSDGQEVTDSAGDVWVFNDNPPRYTPKCKEDINVVYVEYDPDIHTEGVVVGEGTEADPFQIPLPCILPDIHVAQTIKGNPCAVGDEIIIRTRVTNTGTVPIASIDSATSNLVGDVAGDLLPAAPLAVGDSSLAATVYTVTQDDVDAGCVQGSLLVEATDEQGKQIRGMDEVSIAVGDSPRADAVVVSASCWTEVGDEIRFFLRVVNEGYSAITAVNNFSFEQDPTAVFDPAELPIGPFMNSSTSYPYIITQADVDAGFVIGTFVLDMEDENGKRVAVIESYVNRRCPPDACDQIAEFDPGTCEPTDAFVNADCELVPVSEIIPSHLKTSFSAVPETVTDFVLTPGELEPTPDITMVKIGEEQVGSIVIGTGPNGTTSANGLSPFIIPGDILPFQNPTGPYPLTVPATTAGCKVFLQFSVGNQDPNAMIVSLTKTGGTDLGPATLVYQNKNPVTQMAQYIWCFDVLNGGGGDTFDLRLDPSNIPGTGPKAAGVAQIFWYEACDLPSALDIGNTLVTDIGNIPNNTPVDSDPIDLGDCGGVFFGVGRHVGASATPTDNVFEFVDEFWENSQEDGNVIPLTQSNSLNANSVCQMGSVGGYYLNGTGVITDTFIDNSPAVMVSYSGIETAYIPFTTCEALGPDQAEALTTPKALTITNVNKVDGIPRLCVDAAFSTDAAEDSEFCVIPILNGTLMDAYQYPLKDRQVVSLCVDLPVLAPGASTPAVSLQFAIVGKTYTPGDSVTVEACDACLEILHA